MICDRSLVRAPSTEKKKEISTSIKAETKPKLKNRILLPDSEFYWESNNAKKKGGLISLF